ncbi:MAG: N-acetylmuramoyl-L-alanine amidase [Prolixibacteraceae bacterium]|nr:N-acetylmuramoyl-L-alanine amidase [Prolixibacteraceae bacterium]
MLKILNPSYIKAHCPYQIIVSGILIFFSFQLSAQEYQTYKAKKGDGIYSVLKQNGYSYTESLNQFIELNKSKLGKENTLIIGKVYRLPLKTDTTTEVQKIQAKIEALPEKTVYEIFGKKYREITIKSKELAGAIYYLESGHGGPDPGAIGNLNGHILCEDEYAYDVTLRLARNLIECGATVYLIIRDPNDGIRDEQYLAPDKDEVCYPDNEIPLSQLARLKQSTAAVNSLHALNKKKFQRLVVIHVDSRSEKENIDVFFYHDKGSNTGKRLANTLKETFEKKYAMHQPNRGYSGSVSDRNLYVIKNAVSPAVFIELGNINHTRDQQRFINPDNRQAVANWLRDGLIADFKKSIK